MGINAEWHGKNRMPKNATTGQRIKWHLEQSKKCGCRKMPENLLAIIKIAKKELCKSSLGMLKSIPIHCFTGT